MYAILLLLLQITGILACGSCHARQAREEERDAIYTIPMTIRTTKASSLIRFTLTYPKKTLYTNFPTIRPTIPVKSTTRYFPRPFTKTNTRLPPWITFLKKTTTSCPLRSNCPTSTKIVRPFTTTKTTKTTTTKTTKSTTTTTLTKGPLDAGYLPKACVWKLGVYQGEDPVSNPTLLDCYLQNVDNGNMKWNIDFWIQGQNTHYPDWPADLKKLLADWHRLVWFWLDDISKPFPFPPNVTVVPLDVIPNHELPHQLPIFDWIRTVWNWQEVQSLYFSHVALMMAVEMRGLLPWNLRQMDSLLRRGVLSAWDQYWQDDNQNNSAMNFIYNGDVNTNEIHSYKPRPDTVSPSHVAYVWRWFKQLGIIDNSSKALVSTPLEALGKVLDWCRWNMAHYLGGFTWDNANYYWPPYQLPPIAQIIEGTTCTDPQYPSLGNQKYHWTAGCYGTVGFIQTVARPLGITTEWISDQRTCQHTLVNFTSLGYLLSHGDDLYSGGSRGIDGWFAPIQEILTTPTEWNDWFGGTNYTRTCNNVGRKPVEVSIQYPTWTEYSRYCYDLSQGWGTNGTIADGYVAKGYSGFYNASELAAKGLYTKLDALVSVKGCPVCFMCQWGPCCIP